MVKPAETNKTKPDSDRRFKCELALLLKTVIFRLVGLSLRFFYFTVLILFALLIWIPISKDLLFDTATLFGTFLALLILMAVIHYLLWGFIYELDYYHLQGLRRTKRMSEQAREINGQLVLKGSHILPELRDFPLFTHKSKFDFEGIKNLIQAKVDDALISIFDYRYTYEVSYSGGSGTYRSSSSRTVTRDNTVFFVISNRLDLPVFSLQPKGFGLKIANWFSKKDIEIVAEPDFSRLYSLRGADSESIKSVFNGEILSFLNRLVDQRIHIEAAGNKFILYKKKRVKLREIGSFIYDGLALLAAIRS